MEWGCTLLRIGYAEQNQHRPQHTIVLRQPLPSLDSQEQEWYSFVAPLLQTAWDRLMLSSFLASSSSSSSSSGNTNTNARRVVCVHSPYLPRAWERAITQALWNLQVPSIALVHNVETVPIALGWKRGMVVHVGMDEAQCLAHVDGHPLRYTYQGKNTAVCLQVSPSFLKHYILLVLLFSLGALVLFANKKLCPVGIKRPCRHPTLSSRVGRVP